MVPSSRQQNPTVEQQLFDESYRFDFYQAVRLLEKLKSEVQEILSIPIEIRFFSTVSHSFPASDIQEIILTGLIEITNKERRVAKLVPFKNILEINKQEVKVSTLSEVKTYITDKELIAIKTRDGCQGYLKQIELAIQVNFMGLAGAFGPLPPPYTELIMERIWKYKDFTLRDFLDIFNHQLISLLYRARKTQRIGLETGTPWNSHFSKYLFALMGLGTSRLRNQMKIKDNPLLFYAGLLVHQSRSLDALETLLEDFFQVTVKSEAFLGQWRYLPEEEYSYLSRHPKTKELVKPLKIRPVLGTRVWDQQGKFALYIGPLDIAHFLDFLPTGTGYEPLCALTRFFVGHELDFEINLILKASDIPKTTLSRDKSQGAPLGWTSWLKTQASSNNASIKLLPH